MYIQVDCILYEGNYLNCMKEKEEERKEGKGGGGGAKEGKERSGRIRTFSSETKLLLPSNVCHLYFLCA